MAGHILSSIEQTPIIAAVKNDSALEQVLSRDNRVVFLLYGDVCSLPGTVERLHRAEKLVMVHTDLITGLAPKEVAVDYVSSRSPGRWRHHYPPQSDPPGPGSWGFSPYCAFSFLTLSP